MPKLLLFAPCERVLYDPEGLVSLITVIEKMEITVPAALQIPPRSGMPQRWQCIAIWSMDQSEIGQYEEMNTLVVREGPEEIIAAETEPKVMERALPSTSTGVKIISTLTAVPIVNDQVFLRLFYRRIGEQNWTQAAEYPVEIVVVRK